MFSQEGQKDRFCIRKDRCCLPEYLQGKEYGVVKAAVDVYCERETSAVKITSFPLATTDSSARALVLCPLHGIALAQGQYFRLAKPFMCGAGSI